MKSLKQMNKKGFTLIEIIVVIIIIGVLASLALPRLFSTVDSSKAAEALRIAPAIREAAERCLIATTTDTNCITGANVPVWGGATGIDLANPGGIFTYTVTHASDAVTTIVAAGTAAGGLSPTNDRITFTYPVGGKPTVVGLSTGKFASVNH